MAEGLEGITVTALGLALDAASLRQRAAAANIANASTEGYLPVRVSFEAQLEEARAALESKGHLDAASLAEVRPALEKVTRDEAGLPPKVMLDVEVAGMSRNAAHYQTLVKALSLHYAILSAAVSDGKK
jgi:flagellar basal-body rod protein FlgB